MQSVCKGYEHTTLVDNELRVFLLSFICVILFLPQGGMGFSLTPDRDYCCFYPCEMIISQIPVPAPGKDKNEQPHVVHTLAARRYVKSV